MSDKIDVVVPYVNPNDISWQQEFIRYKEESNEPYKENRFRDTSFLKYVLLSIEKNMKFVNKIHLVVASESQIPNYVNRKKVNIVLHKDFIPVEFLPTFNCNTIEMFMHRIPNLAEKFIYFNDDIIVNKECVKEDFFKDDKCNIVSKIRKEDVGKNTWYNCLLNDTKEINDILNIKEEENTWHMFPHTITPYNKTYCDYVFNILKNKIYKRITRFRDYKNFNQHLYAYYIEIIGKISGDSISVDYINISKYKPSFLSNANSLTICLNDVVYKDEEYIMKKHKEIINDLEKKFKRNE